MPSKYVAPISSETCYPPLYGSYGSEGTGREKTHVNIAHSALRIDESQPALLCSRRSRQMTDVQRGLLDRNNVFVLPEAPLDIMCGVNAANGLWATRVHDRAGTLHCVRVTTVSKAREIENLGVAYDGIPNHHMKTSHTTDAVIRLMDSQVLHRRVVDRRAAFLSCSTISPQHTSALQ